MAARVVYVTFLLILAAAPAGGQTRLYALFSGTYPCSALGCPVGTLIDIDGGSGRVLGTAPVSPGWRSTTPGVTPDGRYLVFNGYRSPGAHLDALDTASYAVASFPVTERSSVFGFAPHPGESKVFFQRPEDEQVFVVDLHGTRVLQGLPAQPGQLRAVTADGSLLVFHRTRTNDVVLADSATGQVQNVVTGAYGVVAVNADGSEIYAFGEAASLSLERRAVSNGAVLSSTALTYAGNVTFTRDPRTGHLWQAANGRIRVLDGSTLTTKSERAFAFGTAPASIAFDPDHPIAYLGWKATYESDGRPAHFVVFNTDTIAVEAEADIFTPGLGFIHALVLGPRPPQVTALSANTNGSTVTLGWTTAASQNHATHLTIEAGSASGLANLARFVVPAGSTTLAVADVPAGTYFVRVRSSNLTGGGAASNEIMVTVP